jgi:hypothetical protein
LAFPACLQKVHRQQLEPQDSLDDWAGISLFPGDTDVLASAIEGGFEKDNSPAVDAVDEKEAIGTGDAAIDL